MFKIEYTSTYSFTGRRKGLGLDEMDFKTALIQRKGFEQEIYMKPPKESCKPSDLWRLLDADYCIL